MSFLRKVCTADSWNRLSNHEWKVASVPEFYDEMSKKEWLNITVTLNYENGKLYVTKTGGRQTQITITVNPTQVTFANGTLSVPAEYNGIKSTMSFKML